MDNQLASFEDKLNACAVQLENTHVQLENAKLEVQKPFSKEDELKEKSARLDELNILLNMDKRDNEIVDDEKSEEEPEEAKARTSREWER